MNNRVAKMYRWALEIDYKHDDLPWFTYKQYGDFPVRQVE